MIHPDTPIRWLGIYDQTVHNTTIADLYRKYIERSHPTDVLGDVNFITFDEERYVKIQDWYGWTDIISIERHSNIPLRSWRDVSLFYDHHRKIRVTSDELIPVYEQERAMRGFHGEIKYPYILKRSKDLEIDDRLRIRDVDYPVRTEFSLIQSNEVPNGDKDYGYRIITKSRFYNANGFHLYGSTIIDDDAAAEWGWK